MSVLDEFAKVFFLGYWEKISSDLFEDPKFRRFKKRAEKLKELIKEGKIKPQRVVTPDFESWRIEIDTFGKIEGIFSVILDIYRRQLIFELSERQLIFEFSPQYDKLFPVLYQKFVPKNT